MNGLIDYAGLFPPAKLPLNEAVAEYISHFEDKKNGYWEDSSYLYPN